MDANDSEWRPAWAQLLISPLPIPLKRQGTFPKVEKPCIRPCGDAHLAFRRALVWVVGDGCNVAAEWWRA